MSISEGPRRYVSTLRIQLSGSRSQGPNGPLQTHVQAGDVTSIAVRDKQRRLKASDPPTFAEPLKDCMLNEGSDIILRGIITGSQPIRTSWLHNGELLRFGQSSLVGEEITLRVPNCLLEDAGAYTCVAENTAGKTSSSAAVCVRDYETIMKARDKTTHTSCPSHPPKENGDSSVPRNVPEDVFRGLNSPQTGDCETLFSEATRKGSEVYVKRRSSSGTAPPLHFIAPFERLEVRVGETARLSCAFKGSSPTVSCWTRDGLEVEEDSRLHIESADESSSLVISQAVPGDSGRYTIYAKDRKSSAQHTVALNIIDRPEPPASCPVAFVLSPVSLVLSWSGPSYDGGSAVTTYVVEVRDSAGTDDWTEVTGQCKSTSLKVTSGLQPQRSYRFRIKACNAVGVSEPSQESEPIRMEHSEDSSEQTAAEYVDVTINTESKVTDHYNVLEKLGAGKFGQVFRMIHKETGHVCAGKFYKGRRIKEREAARKEIELMNDLHHPKLVQCLAAYENKAEMVMLLEYVAGGELFERIIEDSFEHTETTCVGYMHQILEGVQYMHQQNIIHLDLKPENIVCVDRIGIQLKIIDFGLACKLDPSTPLKVMQGTPEFVAPEVINFEPVTLATDMWSIGVICYILLSGESPFQGESDTETLAMVTAAQWEFDEDSFEEISDLAKTFISAMLCKDVRRRMSSAEALAHAWMAFTCMDNSSATKNLSKEKMRKFLTRQKWKKTGKALLALKRMAILSKPDSSGSVTPTDELDQTLKSLELKLQSKPEFSKTPADVTVWPGSSAALLCVITGYPDPEVVWLKDDELLPMQEGRLMVDYEEDGTCTLTLLDVLPHHAGVYSCRATNDHGVALCSAKLTVLMQ